MAEITVLALDPETRDLFFDASGGLAIRSGGEAIAQNLRNNLLTWKGEFPLNKDHGTEWTRVVALPLSDSMEEADDVLRASIFQEPYVKEITELSPRLECRSLGAAFRASLFDGSEIGMEVAAHG